MSRDAIKFIDLKAFFAVMDEQGLGAQARAVIYERGREPMYSAFLIPIEMLPAEFDFDQLPRFGGTMTKVTEINYLGTEKFYVHHMVYPLSMIGYVEVDAVSPLTFAAKQLDQKEDGNQMIYVVNLEDGGGQEFFLTTNGGLINISTVSQEQPQEFKTYKLAEKKIETIRGKYPTSCRIYAVGQKDFDERRTLVQTPPPDDQTPID